MGSTRLPGKVLRMLEGSSVLAHVIARVSGCPRVDRVVVATTDQPGDDAVALESRAWSADVFRGSEDDVLSRYYGAARATSADVVVRVTSDCPLFDGSLLTRMLAEFFGAAGAQDQADYLSNTLIRSYPRGLDTEIFTFDALARAHREAGKLYQREHVTPYIWQNPQLFRLRNFAGEQDLSHHRWTLDTEADWTLIQAVYSALGQEGRSFSTDDVLRLLTSRPELVRINADVPQKRLEA